MARPPQTIGQIINAFEQYALGDIRHNNKNSIAAFILCMCFIDHISFFRYSNTEVPKKADRPDKFIDTYMNAYGGFGFYNLARHSVVHFYTSEGRFDIDHRGFESVPYREIGGIIYLNTNVLIFHIETAFQAVKRDFLIAGSPANINALDRSRTHPVLVDTVGKRMTLSAQIP